MPGQEDTGDADWTSSIVAILEYRYSSLIPGKYLFFNLLCLLVGNTCKTGSSYLVMKSKIQFVAFFNYWNKYLAHSAIRDDAEGIVQCASLKSLQRRKVFVIERRGES
jgi:hypothetical protein